jgi:hypothetical protein
VAFSAGGDGGRKAPDSLPGVTGRFRQIDEGIVEFRVHGAQHETYYDSEIYAVYDGGALLPSGGFDCCG